MHAPFFLLQCSSTLLSCRWVQVQYRPGSTVQRGLLGQALAVNKEARKTLSQIAHIDVLYCVAWPLSIVITEGHIHRCRRLLSVFLQVLPWHATLSAHVYHVLLMTWSTHPNDTKCLLLISVPQIGRAVMYASLGFESPNHGSPSSINLSGSRLHQCRMMRWLHSACT